MPTAIHSVVGKVTYKLLQPSKYGGAIELVSDLPVSKIHIPELEGTRTYENQKISGDIFFYTPAHYQLKAAFQVCGILAKRGVFNWEIQFWAGSWVKRTKRGSKTSPSNHTFATAFDINPYENPFNKPYTKKGRPGSVYNTAQIFKELGFEWGGDWTSPDGMHIEVKRILSRAEVDKTVNRILGQRPTNSFPENDPPEPKLVIILTNKDKSQTRNLVMSSKLSAKGFEVDAGELAAILHSNFGTIQAREFMTHLGFKPYEEVDKLKTEGRYELYI